MSSTKRRRGSGSHAGPGQPTLPMATHRPNERRTTSLIPLIEKGSDRPFRELIYALISLFNLMRSNQEHFAAYIGVTVPQITMMSFLDDSGRATVGQIASRIEVSSQFVTLEIGKLLEKGLVEKRANEEDGRSVVLELTEAGQCLMRELAPLRRETNDLMFRSLTAEQVHQLRSILGALLADGRSALHELESPRWREQRAPSLAQTRRRVAGKSKNV